MYRRLVSCGMLLVLSSLVSFSPSTALAKGGWTDPPGGWDYIYEASAGQDQFVAGNHVVGLLDGSWAQSDERSFWDGSAPGVYNTTTTDVDGNLVPPGPGGVQVICPVGETGEDGGDLCYLAIEDIGNPTSATLFTPPWVDPSNRKLYFYHAVSGNSEDGWTLMARLRLSPVAIDPNMNTELGFNGATIAELPMVAVHDTAEGTVGFSINDAGRLVVLADATANEIDIGTPTEWVTVWLSAVERSGTPEGVYDIQVYVDGATGPALTLMGVQAPLSEITDSPDDWIAIGCGHTDADAAFQIDYVAYKAGAWTPGSVLRCPTTFTASIARGMGLSAVNLAWTLPAGATYDSFDILRDGATLVTGLAGTATAHLDLEVLPGQHSYDLVARGAGGDCTLTTEIIQCLFDLQCGFRAGTAAGTVDTVLTWTNPGALDSIAIRRRLQREGDVGEADEELGTIPGSATEYIDLAIPSGDLTRITYTVTATVAGTTCELQCRPTTCPGEATCTSGHSGANPQVVVQWTLGRAFDSIRLSRRVDTTSAYTEIATLAGDVTSYTDTAVADFGYFEYEILGIQAGTAEVCPAVTCRSTILPEEVGYAPPAGGWDYNYDVETGTVQYNPTIGEAGNLDGSWIRSTVEDQWDGSALGDTGSPPGGPAPGGITIDQLAAADPCGVESRRVLRLEDAGDPRAFGFPDPGSNRKLFLGRDLANGTENLLRSGVTFSLRARLTPEPTDIPREVGNLHADGAGLTKGYGMLGIYFRNPGTVETEALGTSAGFGLALEEGAATVSTEPQTQLPGVPTEKFHTLWATIRDPEADNTYEIQLFIDGSTVPLSLNTALQVPASTVANNDTGLGSISNFLAIALVDTASDSSIQVDYVAWKKGVFTPSVQGCGPGSGFRRGDADGNGGLNITDGIFILNYLFIGGPTPGCLESANPNDDAQINITDGIYVLNYLFLGGPAPTAPGSESCGPDPVGSPTDLGCVSYTKC